LTVVGCGESGCEIVSNGCQAPVPIGGVGR
jgi:hypothetical protein